jgi:hypothetical protein
MRRPADFLVNHHVDSLRCGLQRSIAAGGGMSRHLVNTCVEPLLESE